MTGSYRVISTSEGEALVRVGSESSLLAADAVAFDCDGVLVDARESYDAAIAVTTQTLLEEMLGTSPPLERKISLLIHRLRKTGGFNNDWDTTYALTIFALLALPAAIRRRIAVERLPTATPLGGPDLDSRVAEGISRLIDRYVRSTRSAYRTVDRFVLDKAPSGSLKLFRLAKSYLGYPGVPPSSLLSTLFDEIYHGESLFAEIYGFEATHWKGKGLIRNERLLMGESDLDAISTIFKRGLAIDTGRPRKAAEHTMGRLLERFDIDASLFLGDRDDGDRRVGESYRKPSPLSLLFVKDRLNSSELLYLGDSAEDLMMAVSARRRWGSVVFAGVYGSSHDPSDQIEFFKNGAADLILPAAKSICEAYGRIGIG